MTRQFIPKQALLFSLSFLAGIFYLGLEAKPIHEKLWVGMPLKHFNALDLGPLIFSQSQKKTLTEFGVVNLKAPSTKRYFDLKNSIWKGVMVDIQNNQLSQYTLQGSQSIANAKLQNLFSELIRLHGTEFSLNNYRSLSKKGYSVIWYKGKELVSLNIVLGKNNKNSITLKKAIHNNKSKQRQLDEKAIAALEPYLGKDFHTIAPFQVASDSKVDSQLDQLLSN